MQCPLFDVILHETNADQLHAVNLLDTCNGY